ncbi:unnamed protein product [Caenorhabditis brenneri]
MSKTPELTIYEKAFAKSDKTDAILVVQGKKLHVNKTLLSCHSDYFNTLFNSNFKEKSMEEIEIKEVDFEDFATVLSLIHPHPIEPTVEKARNLLDLADQFFLPAAKRHLDLFLTTTKIDRLEKLRIADKYDLDALRDHALELYSNKYEFRDLYNATENFSDRTKSKLYDRFFTLVKKAEKKMSHPPDPSIHEKTFTKSDKTDAILVVDGKKLHVNKALLSYHSEYFDKLFNSDFKENSIKEIEIKDVDFKDFVTLLSLIDLNPDAIKKDETEKLLELADRFLMGNVKRYLEQFLINSEKKPDALIGIAEKYQLNGLMDITLSKYQERDFWIKNCLGDVLYKKAFYEKLSDETNIKLFHRWLEVNNKITEKPQPKTPDVINIYEKTFAKCDKTDGILVIDGKKLHVNKAVLSYHSDFFNALFNSEFKEKSMEEIEIKDVKFENFATLLSMIYLNPIAPTEENVENILKLSDRFLIPCAKYYLEPFIIVLQLDNFEKIRIGEKYELSELLQNGINSLKPGDFTDLPSNPIYQALSSSTKRKLFERTLCRFFL